MTINQAELLEQLKAAAATVHREVATPSLEQKIAELREMAAQLGIGDSAATTARKAAVIARVPSTRAASVGADSLLVDGYLWTWNCADVEGKTFTPYDLSDLMRLRQLKSYGGAPAVFWHHGHAENYRRHGDVLGAAVDGTGLRVQMRVDAPQTQDEAARLQPGGGLSMGLDPTGTWLDHVSLTDTPKHPGARIVSVGPYR